MRLLEINTEHTWRGGERQTCSQVAGFRDAGIEVELLCLKGGPLARKALSLGIPVHEVRTALGAFFFLIGRGGQYDILHAQTARAQSYAILSRFSHHRPVVYTRRVDFVPRGNFSRYKYHQTDRVVTISGAIRDILRQIGLRNIEVIPSAVVPHEPDEVRIRQFHRLFNREGRRIVATVAALVPHKDPVTMVRMVEELSGLRSDFVFLHFGDGPLMNRIKNMVREKGLESTYRFAGNMDNVEDFFRLFDIFVMSSEEEGLGSSVLDAFLHKVPVASTAAGGLEELVSGRGRLCPVKDYRCLAHTVHELLDDQQLCAELTGVASDYVTREHSSRVLTGKYVDLFNDLLKTTDTG